MTIEQIHARCKCCITEKPLSTSANLNMLQLDKKATWSYPVWGNFLTGHKNMACAFVHDECWGDDGKLKGKIKYAVECSGNEIIYHPVEDIEAPTPL